MIEGMRLQKYIALCGVASRRKAEELIDKGSVKVNDEVISFQGYKLKDGDVVRVSGEIIKPEENKVYILLNKPAGVVSTVKDEAARRTVLDCIEGVTERLYPVGRLDYNTTGLIILSNDGDFTKFMTHPSHQVAKTYIVRADGEFDEGMVNALRNGVDIGGYITAKAKVSHEDSHRRQDVLKITIYEGKNRQVRRMVEAVGLRVRSLRRIGIGNIFDPKLKTGEWRSLTPKELRGLGYDIG